jgi:hypothetical protein
MAQAGCCYALIARQITSYSLFQGVHKQLAFPVDGLEAGFDAEFKQFSPGYGSSPSVEKQ